MKNISTVNMKHFDPEKKKKISEISYCGLVKSLPCGMKLKAQSNPFFLQIQKLLKLTLLKYLLCFKNMG